MSWKKVGLILAAIVAVHAVVLFRILPKERKSPVETPPAKTENEVSVPKEDEVKPPAPPPSEPPPEPAPAMKRLAPWDYRGQGVLPADIAKHSARARSGILVDLESRKVLWSKDPRRPVAVASLTKLMTALLVAEKMHHDRNWRWNTPLKVSKNVVNVERSCVLGMKEGEYYAVGELMQSMIINSHNDSAVMLAENVSGSVEEFVRAMNRRGGELGMTGLNFNSPNGLPQGKKRINSFASAEDISHICEALIQYSKVMELCTMRSAQLHTGKKVYSHNNLLLGPTKRQPKRRPVPGIIGFKTGFTNAAGCCLAFGVKRNGRTVIGCVTGFPSALDRDNFCREIIEWAYRKKP
ncbi:MAG: serine hydrolase [Lentisphaeria bacterium]|nr:serine hydrolase [Lentisphaeria bacterium]